MLFTDAPLADGVALHVPHLDDGGHFGLEPLVESRAADGIALFGHMPSLEATFGMEVSSGRIIVSATLMPRMERVVNDSMEQFARFLEMYERAHQVLQSIDSSSEEGRIESGRVFDDMFIQMRGISPMRTKEESFWFFKYNYCVGEAEEGRF